jgi:hypothetical protein
LFLIYLDELIYELKNISPNPSSKRGILTILFILLCKIKKYQTTTVSLFEEGVREMSAKRR